MTLDVLPTSERWKPLRAGLVDMFYYDMEEFHFHDGRLLLRGNNGTGKSKVLALTLPFLLDGELSPHRVEPDGDRQKKMEWNLLLGGKHPHSERVGYTWLEFGRVGPGGTTEFRTIGCGMKAVKDRGIARHWFFVTPQRIGSDLVLHSASGVPLTRERLRDAVEGSGMVYDRATDYRRAVDEALFGLGEHRYAALVNLLIQLRQPQLSKKPNEKMLSAALTEALPPISPALIRTVADAFRGLDDDRQELDALKDASRAAGEFLGHYRRYARIASKLRARRPRETQSKYEQLNRDLSAAESRYSAADSALETASSLITGLATVKVQLEARREALRESPEMRDARRLEELKQSANSLSVHASRLARDEQDLRAESSRRQNAYLKEKSRSETAQSKLATALGSAAIAASAALIQEPHSRITSRLDTDSLAVRQEAGLAGHRETDLSAVRREADGLAARQTTAIAEVERLIAVVDKHLADLSSARVEVDRLTAAVQDDAARIAVAEQAISAVTTSLAQLYRDYLADAQEFQIPDIPLLLETFGEWAASVEGANPVAEAVSDAVQSASASLGRLEAGVRASLETSRLTASALGAEISRLEAGGHDAPPAPYTRDQAARAERLGAPFWKAVDFASGVSEADRAGLEAALEAAGILDAWLTPDGELLDVSDTSLLSSSTPVDGPSCLEVLRPAFDRADPHAGALPDDAVRFALSAIGLGPTRASSTWVSVDGRWANGVLEGSWHKESATFIGEGAREQARRAQLSRLRSELEVALESLSTLESELVEVASRQETLDLERRAFPPDVTLRQAHMTLAGEYKRQAEHTEQHSAASKVAQSRAAAVSTAQEQLEEFCSDVGVPSSSLADVKAGLADYRVALAGLWPAASEVRAAGEAVSAAHQEFLRTEEKLAEARLAAEEAGEKALTAQETYRVMEETVGSAVQELQQQLAAVQSEMARRDIDERAARAQENTAREERGKADGERSRLHTEISDAEAERDIAVADFQQFAASGLLQVALPELEIPAFDSTWATTPTVILARQVNADLEKVDEGAWDRVQKRVTDEHKLLADAMARHGHSVGLTLRAEVMVVDVVFQGKTRDIPELATALEAEISQRAQLLSAREREILENHLLNEVAGTLHELISEAEHEVQKMNEELSSRPTSTGMRLRLIWRPAKDAPDGLEKVRTKLRQTIDAWSVADRSMVGEFLQEQISREHLANPASGWTDQLTRALDYRLWHEFAIQRYQEGQWRSATGPASGGERALVASVPLFAAASAHYKSASNPHAPRLVALDEAFAGVDDDSRAKCLGLLAHFDMDVVMTSEREWGCYPEVPGLAISHLARRDGVDAVLVTPWRWDGRERRRVERPVPA